MVILAVTQNVQRLHSPSANGDGEAGRAGLGNAHYNRDSWSLFRSIQTHSLWDARFLGLAISSPGTDFLGKEIHTVLPGVQESTTQLLSSQKMSS